MALDEGPRDPVVDQGVRELAKSLGIDFRTDAPYAMSGVRVEKVGFGNIPMVYVVVCCKEVDRTVLVAIARQAVYRELEAAGIPSEILCITAGVQEQGTRRSKFVDTNEASPSCGKNKFGCKYRYSFEIKNPKFLDYFEWESAFGRHGKIPEKA